MFGVPIQRDVALFQLLHQSCHFVVGLRRVVVDRWLVPVFFLGTSIRTGDAQSDQQAKNAKNCEATIQVSNPTRSAGFRNSNFLL